MRRAEKAPLSAIGDRRSWLTEREFRAAPDLTRVSYRVPVPTALCRRFRSSRYDLTTEKTPLTLRVKRS
jgi:hypothetical protein